jgi:type III effector protein AvrPto1
MGNTCVRGSSHDNGYYSDHSEDPRVENLNNLNTSLTNLGHNRRLTEEQMNFLNSEEAPRELQESYNALLHQTIDAENLANVERARLSGQSLIYSGVPSERHVETLDNISSGWTNMRERVQHAIERSRLPGDRGRIIQNPSGSLRWGQA